MKEAIFNYSRAVYEVEFMSKGINILSLRMLMAYIEVMLIFSLLTCFIYTHCIFDHIFLVLPKFDDTKKRS